MLIEGEREKKTESYALLELVDRAGRGLLHLLGQLEPGAVLVANEVGEPKDRLLEGLQRGIMNRWNVAKIEKE